jgi:hypothetical protein
MGKMILQTFGVFGLILFIVAVIVFGPFATIWSVNTLFPSLAIPYSFDTWLAVVLLGAFIGRDSTVKVTK